MCLIHDNWQWHRLGECSWGRRHLALYGAPQVYEPMRAFPYQPEVTQWPHISSLILPPWLDTEESWYSSCGTLYSKSPRLNSIIMVKWAKNIFWVECGNNLVSITYCTTSLISYTFLVIMWKLWLEYFWLDIPPPKTSNSVLLCI